MRKLHLGCLGASVLAAAGLSACANWSPPVYSPALSLDEDCTRFAGAAPADAKGNLLPTAKNFPKDLQALLDDMDSARRRYVHMSRCLTQDRSLGSAALGALGAAALFLGVTKPHPKDIAGIGAGGAWIYTSSGLDDGGIAQRRQLLRAGAEAMACNIKAIEVYRNGAAWHDDGAALKAQADAATLAAGDLAGPGLTLASEVAFTALGSRGGKAAPARCKGLPACVKPKAGASLAEEIAYQRCVSDTSGCAETPATSVQWVVHPKVQWTSALITDTQAVLRTQLREAAAIASALGVPAGEMRRQMADIQTSVGDRSAALYRDGAATLAGVGQLKSTAHQITKASFFAATPPAAAASGEAGVSHSTGPGKSSALREHRGYDRSDMKEAVDALVAAQNASRKLETTLVEIEGRRVQASRQLLQCATLVTQLAGAQPAAVPPAPAEPASTPEAAPVVNVVLSDLDKTWLAGKLGLPADTAFKTLQEAVAACQLRKLDKVSTGASLDTASLALLTRGECQGGGA